MSKHVKRLAAPRSWKIPKKNKTFISKPSPGTHKTTESIALVSLIRDYLGYAANAREARQIIQSGGVLIDNTARKDSTFPVGLMDIVSVPATKEYFVVLFDKRGKLFLSELKKKEAENKFLKIVGKTIIKGGNLQLNLHDGRNILIPVKDPKKPKEDVFKTGDTLVFDLTKKAIKDHLKFEKGATVVVTAGSHRSKVVTVEETKVTRSSIPNEVFLKGEDGKTFRTISDYVFVIPGADK
jgi:small subunit ribosomal protein S4e